MQAKHQHSRGSALISALFIMTLVAIAATAMSTRLQLDIYRTRLIITSDQLYLASQAVTFWGMDILAAEKPPIVNDKQGRLAHFPSQLQSSYPDVTTEGALYDLQAFFNLNNLQDKKFHPLFFRLLENTLHKSNNAERKSLFNALYVWISPYQAERGHDEYLSFYLKQLPPYLPAYQPMQNISELRLLRGITPEIYQTMLRHTTALPSVTPININTASKLVLMSLGNGLNETQVNEILQARGKEGISTPKDIYSLIQKLDIPNDQVTTESQYFLSVAITKSQDLKLTTYTVIQRNKDQKGKISINLVSESLNTT